MYRFIYHKYGKIKTVLMVECFVSVIYDNPITTAYFTFIFEIIPRYMHIFSDIKLFFDIFG